MGTRFNLLLPGIDNHKGDEIFSSVTNELLRIEKLLSCFLSDSDISYINENAYKKPVSVNDEVFGVLTECIDFYKLTQETFDIGLGYIIDYWTGRHTELDQEPDINLAGAKNIILENSDKTVRLATPQVKINLGGYGKGYALQKNLEILKKSGIKTALMSFGESSVTCLGKHPHGEYWPVGIQDFYQKKKSLTTFEVVDGSVSTSGNLQNENHIINPVNGNPITEKMSISVKSDSAVIAEVLSTALMVARDDQIEMILKSFPKEEVIRVEYNNNKTHICKLNKRSNEDNKNIKAGFYGESSCR